MKKLLSVSALSLALLIPSVSFADLNAFGVQTPVAKSEVSDDLKGGRVEMDFISFYISPKGENIDTDLKQANNASEVSSLVVFGVSIPTSNNT